LVQDSLKPINLIKATTLELIAAPNLKSNLIQGAIHIGTNYLTNKLVNQEMVNPIKKVLQKLLAAAFKKIGGKRSKEM
jgi:hypothetical protein